jgi:hypothetical protein
MANWSKKHWNENRSTMIRLDVSDVFFISCISISAWLTDCRTDSLSWCQPANWTHGFLSELSSNYKYMRKSDWCLNTDINKSGRDSLTLMREWQSLWCLNIDLRYVWENYIGAWILTIQICESLSLVFEYWP